MILVTLLSAAALLANISWGSLGPRERFETTPEEETFFRAINDHDCQAVKRLLEKNSSLAKSCNKLRNPAILMAVACGQEEIVKLLLDAGADIFVAGPDRLNAVQFSCLPGRENIREMLRKHLTQAKDD